MNELKVTAEALLELLERDFGYNEEARKTALEINDMAEPWDSMNALRLALARFEWISVDDDLPKIPGMMTFVAYKSGWIAGNVYNVVLARWKEGKWWWNSSQPITVRILYWQPVYWPDPPEIEKGGMAIPGGKPPLVGWPHTSCRDGGFYVNWKRKFDI